MEFNHNTFAKSNLEMANDDAYKKMAKGYKDSDEYNKMINLYPVLESSIKDCKNEKLIN